MSEEAESKMWLADEEEYRARPQEVMDAKLREFGLMFSQLMESERFRELVTVYFTFIKFVNEDTKEIEIQVIENPPEVIAAKMKAKLPEEPQIQVVSGVAAQKVLEKAKETAGGRRHKDPKRR